MKKNGFTLLELLITIAIVSIAAGVGLPNFTQFLERNRVENKLSEVSRLLMFARSQAVSAESIVTVCPLVSGSCSNDWSKEIVVFMDSDFSMSKGADEEELRVSNPIKDIDTLIYSRASISYEPTGMLANPLHGGTFKFCPGGTTNANSKAIIVTSHSGRVRYSDNSVSCSS